MNRAALFDQASNRTVTEEDRSTILSTFYQSDLRQKGYLSRQDVKAAVLALFGYKPSKVEVDGWLEDVVSTDGIVCRGLTVERFVTIMLSKMSARDEDEHIRQMFLAFDMQCRGFVSCDDLKKVFALTAPRMPQRGVETAFRELDRDGDGRVSFKDFDFAMKYDVSDDL